VHTATQTITVGVDAGTPIAGTPTVSTPNLTTGTVSGTAVFSDLSLIHISEPTRPY